MRHEDGGHLHTAVVWLVTQARKGTSWLDASYRGKSLSREIYAHGVWGHGISQTAAFVEVAFPKKAIKQFACLWVDCGQVLISPASSTGRCNTI